MVSIRELILFALLLLFVSSASSEIFRWVDEAGNVHFGDSPPSAYGAEKMELKLAEPDPEDPGTLRRKRLLEKAEQDAKARLKRRNQQSKTSNEKRTSASLIESNCMEMRRQLDVLEYKMPVYIAENGKYRFKWENDTYRGTRVYISDIERAEAINNLNKDINSQCAHQDEGDARKAAHQQNVFSEKCAEARVELEAILNPNRRAVESDIERARRRVQFYCEA